MFYTIPNGVFGEDILFEPNLHQVVIKDPEQGLYPYLIEAGKGDTVVWYNQGVAPVRIRFLSALGIICAPIINFNGDIDGIFISDEIPRGGIASLCLIDEGVFDYEVVRLNSAGQKLGHLNIMQGKVIVE
jgi:hypothetical protein